jgi:hypothetical protein
VPKQRDHQQGNEKDAETGANPSNPSCHPFDAVLNDQSFDCRSFGFVRRQGGCHLFRCLRAGLSLLSFLHLIHAVVNVGRQIALQHIFFGGFVGACDPSDDFLTALFREVAIRWRDLVRIENLLRETCVRENQTQDKNGNASAHRCASSWCDMCSSAFIRDRKGERKRGAGLG